MLEALSQAAKSSGWPIGAVIVCNGQFISKASNRVVLDQDPTAHAEILAIREACKVLKTHDLHGCELYTSSMSCPMCTAAIKWAKIDKVYYAAKTKDAESIGFDDARMWAQFRELNSCDVIPEFEAVSGWCETAAREILKDWHAKNQPVLVEFLVPDMSDCTVCQSVCRNYHIVRHEHTVYTIYYNTTTPITSYPTFKEAVDGCNKHARSCNEINFI